MTMPKWMVAMAMVACVTTQSAQADTKAGVDAFMQGNYTTAVAIWRPLAIAGDSDAQYNLAQAYWLGRGVAADPKQAEDWYRRAAELGQPKARDALGLLLFQTGRQREALPLIEESAGRGMPQAQYVYATLLFNGDMVEKDWVRSYALMTRASAGGVTAAATALAQLDRFIPLEQRQRGLNLARAFEQAASKPDTSELPAATITAAKPLANPKPAPVTTATAKPALPKPAPLATPKPVPTKPIAPKQVASKPAAPKAIVAGSWRVQLGAFGTAAQANAAWMSLHKRIAVLAPYQGFVVAAGPVTRLRVGPLPDRAAAARVCAAVKASGAVCIPTPPGT